MDCAILSISHFNSRGIEQITMKTVFIILLIFLINSCLIADTIVTKNGTYQGRILRANKNAVTFETSKKIMTLDKSQILSYSFSTSDILYLKSGKTINCKIIGILKGYVVYVTPQKAYKQKQADVARIKNNNGPELQIKSLPFATDGFTPTSEDQDKIEDQKIGNSVSVSIGYWKPSLEEVNDALDLWSKTLDEADITPQGDDKFSGNFTVGGTIIVGISERAALRADLSYWKKTINQKAHEEISDSFYDDWYGTIYYTVEFKGEAEASIQLIPVLFSGQYYFGDLQGKIRPYVGGGLGLVFASIAVKAAGKQTIASDYYDETFTDSAAFKADHSSSNIILQAFAGVEFIYSDKISFYAEAKYISGNFNVRKKQYDIDEDVSLSGLQINGGIRFYFRQ